MTILIIVLVVLAVLFGLGAWLILTATDEELQEPIVPTAAPQPVPVPLQKTVVVTHRARKGLIAQLKAIEDRLIAPPVPAPPPVVVPPPVALPKPKAPPAGVVTVRLESAKGRVLGTTQIDARLRKPVLRHRTRDGQMSVFVAVTQADGVWTYRRVGVEREH